MPYILLGAPAQELVLRNRLRKSLAFLNEDGANNIFIKRERTVTPTVSATDHDFRLGPGASIALNTGIDGTEAIQDRWTVIAGAGTPVVSWFETEDIIR